MTTTNTQKEDIATYKGYALKMGIDPALYERVSQADRDFLDLFANQTLANIQKGQMAPKVTPELLKIFYNDAMSDPTINTYYKDQLGLGQRGLQQSMDYINAKDTIEKDNIKRAYEEKQMADNEQAANAANAYSSYRNKVDQNRKLEEFGVTELNRLGNKNNAFQLGNEFEQKFGSNATPNITIGGQSYNKYGGLMGSNEQNRLSNIDALSRNNAASFVTTGALPSTTTMPLASNSPTVDTSTNKTLLDKNKKSYTTPQA